MIRVDAVGLLGKGWAIDGFVVAMDEDVYANVEWDHFSKPFAPAGWLAVRVARVRGWFWRYRGGS